MDLNELIEVKIEETGIYYLVPKTIMEQLVGARTETVILTAGIELDFLKFGEIVKAARKEKNLNQSELGTACRIGERTVRSIEKGEHKPQKETIKSLIGEFGEEFARKLRELGIKTD